MLLRIWQHLVTGVYAEHMEPLLTEHDAVNPGPASHIQNVVALSVPQQR